MDAELAGDIADRRAASGVVVEELEDRDRALDSLASGDGGVHALTIVDGVQNVHTPCILSHVTGVGPAPRAPRSPGLQARQLLRLDVAAVALAAGRRCHGGSTVLHTSPSSRGHRVWKRQPLGGSAGLGSVPWSFIRAFASGSSVGMADSSASV